MSIFKIGIKKLILLKLKPDFVHKNLTFKKVKTLYTRNFCNYKTGWYYINLNPTEYDHICSQTLNSLSDYFEEIVESAENFCCTDVCYNDGVLTVNLGTHGTYVINRQTPNKQIWLSSPRSGPKRYDFFGTKNGEGEWIYKHNGESMHSLLQAEIEEILKGVDFLKLPYSGQN